MLPLMRLIGRKEGGYMKNVFKVILLLSLLTGSCDQNNEVPPPSLPPSVQGQLPTRTAIIQAAEAVGAANVQIISYQVANGRSENAGGVTTDGGFQPSWWRPNVTTWMSGNYHPTLTGVSVVYDETSKMHPNFSVAKAILQLFENAGFTDIWWPGTFKVETTTDNRYRLIPLPTHARIINAMEQLGASNVKINQYLVCSVDFWLPPPIPGVINLYHYHIVPADSNFNGVQGNVGHTNPRVLRLSYEHPGLGTIITNNDVQKTIRELFEDYGFESIDVATTGTLISASYPLPSFNQIMFAAEQAGATNVQVKTYRANNANVISMNEGSRLANVPIIVELTYDGGAIEAASTNVRALFANFNTVHIGNNETATIPLPTGYNIRQAALSVLYFPASLPSDEPHVYTVNGEERWIYSPGSAAWNANIRIVMDGDGTNDSTSAGYAVNAIQRLFNERGFFYLSISVSNR
jgi:hypothetical protein